MIVYVRTMAMLTNYTPLKLKNIQIVSAVINTIALSMTQYSTAQYSFVLHETHTE